MKHAMILLLAALPALAATVHGQGGARRGAAPILLHPGALALMIDQLGGHEVSLARAKVVAMLNPQALLVESPGPLEPAPGFYNRVLILVRGGTIRLPPQAIVGATVRVTGVARTILSMQVEREVPWPPVLTADVLRRYEIRAALLTSAVHTADGVAIVTPQVAALSEPEEAH